VRLTALAGQISRAELSSHQATTYRTSLPLQSRPITMTTTDPCTHTRWRQTHTYHMHTLFPACTKRHLETNKTNLALLYRTSSSLPLVPMGNEQGFVFSSCLIRI
jgi:hypothetical protein